MRNGVVLHGTVYAIHLACVTSQRSHNREDCPWNIDQVVIYEGLDHNGCYIARNQVTASLERLVDPGFSIDLEEHESHEWILKDRGSTAVPRCRAAQTE